MTFTDEQLIKKSVEGDNDAFGILVERYQNKAYAVSLRIVQNRDDALDCVQDSFIKAYNNLKSFNFQSSFNTWLYRIVTNTSLDLIRKNKKYISNVPIEQQSDNDDEYFIQLEDKKANIEQQTISKETVISVHKSIDKLSDNLKKVIILFDIEQFSLNEVSDILDIPVGTVKSRLFRARERLHKILKENGTF